jgi:hypothetical protein
MIPEPRRRKTPKVVLEPDGADAAVVGRDEALARAGFGRAGLADFGVAGLAGPNKDNRLT